MKFFAIALTLACLGLGTNPARAQMSQPGNPSGYVPNFYNRGNQPLSPYLNLLRGGNNAVNYYYGARPGLQSGGYTGMFGNMGNAPRQTFFPIADTLGDLADEPRDAMKVNPTGHPTGFMNTLNYFPGSMPPRGGQQSPAALRRPTR
jgi:hypothetical protein